MIDSIVDNSIAEYSKRKNLIFKYLIELTEQKKELEKQIEDLRSELIKLHQKYGELRIEEEGYRSTLKSLPFSISYLKEEYGIDSKNLPPECFEIKEIISLNQEELEKHLKSKGIELDYKYTINFGKVIKKLDLSVI